jgi:hypothetical protein
MVNALDRAMGVVERTSAEAAEGSWVPGMPTVRGFLWAAPLEGTKYIAFETAPGRVEFGLHAGNLVRAKKVAAGLNMVVEAVMRDGDEDVILTIIGPRGRVKRIFAFLGFNL